MPQVFQIRNFGTKGFGLVLTEAHAVDDGQDNQLFLLVDVLGHRVTPVEEEGITPLGE